MIWRVIIQWSYNGLNFTSERGAIGASPGDAMNAVLNSLRIDRADSFRAFFEPATSITDFSHEASFHPLVNGRGQNIREAFEEIAK